MLELVNWNNSTDDAVEERERTKVLREGFHCKEDCDDKHDALQLGHDNTLCSLAQIQQLFIQTGPQGERGHPVGNWER